MRWETLVARHFSERCLRKYGYVQSLPRPVPNVLASSIDTWFQSNKWCYVFWCSETSQWRATTPPPPDGDDQQRLQMIALIMKNLMGLVNPYYEVFTELTWEAHIANGVIIWFYICIIYKFCDSKYLALYLLLFNILSITYLSSNL